jgi:hypothetical protein
MGLLLGDPDFQQHVENRLALDFQLSGQIVDSNLAHPLCFLRTIPLSLHINLTVSISRHAVPKLGTPSQILLLPFGGRLLLRRSFCWNVSRRNFRVPYDGCCHFGDFSGFFALDCSRFS